MMNMKQVPLYKVDGMQEEIGNVNREMKIIRKKLN